MAETLSLSDGTTPTTLKSALSGFQHLEQPQAWLWATFESRVTSTLLLEHLHWSCPPALSWWPFEMPLSTKGWMDAMLWAICLIILFKVRMVLLDGEREDWAGRIYM